MIPFFFLMLEMKRNVRASRTTLDQKRRQYLQIQIENAYRNVSFYHSLFKEQALSPEDIKEIDDLKKLPVVSKKDIRKNPEAFLNKRLRKESYYKSHTSGSTGEPTWTYYDRHSWYRKKYLSKLRARLACGLSWGEKIAIFESETANKLRKHSRFNFIRNLFF
jgi:phenylacetate-CoA ligase